MREIFDTDERYQKAMRSVLNRIDATGDCMLWTGALKKNGYGQVTLTVKPRTVKHFYVHRLMYLVNCGKIPAEKELHHECFNRHCVNTKHLHVVTHSENMKMMSPQPRKLAVCCGKGHEYTEENTLWTSGRRMCRECKRNRERAYRKGISR